MSYYYKLEGGQPVECTDLLDWGRWFETADRTVARTAVNGAEVSTVFLGMNHNFGFSNDDKPVLWETLVFGGDLDGEMERYCTLDEAKAGHERMCGRVCLHV
jgi:hypothetical protein